MREYKNMKNVTVTIMMQWCNRFKIVKGKSTKPSSLMLKNCSYNISKVQLYTIILPVMLSTIP